MDEIILEIDGEKIPMNNFVSQILFGMIKGSVETLRGVGSDWKTLAVTLKR